MEFHAFPRISMSVGTMLSLFLKLMSPHRLIESHGYGDIIAAELFANVCEELCDCISIRA